MMRIMIGIMLCSIQLLSANTKDYHIEDFDKAMITHSSQQQTYNELLNGSSLGSKFLNFFRSVYQDVFFNNFEFSGDYRIPKIIHQIWLGPPIPELLQKFTQIWRDVHPDWTYILWTEDNIKTLKLINQEYYDEETEYASKANILRYELLYQFGGVYIDTDFMCLKSLDFLHQCCDFYTGFIEMFRLCKWGDEARMNNAIMASKPGHSICKYLIDNLQYFRDEKWRLSRTGVNYYNKILKKYLMNCEGINVVLPSNYFYPWKKISNKATNKKIKDQVCVVDKPETLAIHYYYSRNLHLLAKYQ